MRGWSGLGSRIVATIQDRAERKRLAARGPVGDFYRAGGNDLLYVDLPLSQDDLVIDAGGYKGDWTAGMLTRYGCCSELFEPVPDFAERCRVRYQHNARVRVHQSALGGSNRNTHFGLADNGTSEFRAAADSEGFDARVEAVSDLLSTLDAEKRIHPGAGAVGLLKLNIEGGEYEVLESLLQTNDITRLRGLLIQFHRQPEGWEQRYAQVVEGLRSTHDRVWCFPMVWEQWALK
jgi:FkbM family methyltransferase